MFQPAEILIGNRWVAPATSDRLDVVSPATEEVVGSVGLVVPSLRRDRDRLVSALMVAAKGIGRSAGP